MSNLNKSVCDECIFIYVCKRYDKSIHLKTCRKFKKQEED